MSRQETFLSTGHLPNFTFPNSSANFHLTVPPTPCPPPKHVCLSLRCLRWFPWPGHPVLIFLPFHPVDPPLLRHPRVPIPRCLSPPLGAWLYLSSILSDPSLGGASAGTDEFLVPAPPYKLFIPGRPGIPTVLSGLPVLFLLFCWRECPSIHSGCTDPTLRVSAWKVAPPCCLWLSQPWGPCFQRTASARHLPSSTCHRFSFSWSLISPSRQYMVKARDQVSTWNIFN